MYTSCIHAQHMSLCICMLKVESLMCILYICIYIGCIYVRLPSADQTWQMNIFPLLIISPLLFLITRG